MARQDARKQFVQARLKALGGDATPEQKAKLRQRFNKLSETKEGRTRIAQVVLPSGTAEQRKALKQSIRPVKSTGTSTGTTGGSTTGGSTTGGSTTGGKSKVDLTGVRDAKPYRPTVISDSNTPKNNSQSSAVIPSAQKTNVYGDTFEEKVALKLEQWNIPVFGRVAGIGRAIDEGKTSTAVQKLVAAGLDALVTGATIGAVTGLKKGTTPTPTSGSSNPFANQTLKEFKLSDMQKALESYKGQPLNTNISRPNNPFVGLKSTQFDPSKMRSALESYKGTPTIPSKITGANKPTSMPTTPNFKKTPEFTAGGIDSYPRFENAPGTKTPKRGSVTTETPGGKKTPTSIPTATTVPKVPTTAAPKKTTVTTVPTSVSPPSTAPRQYDERGKGIGEPLDIRVGDPMPVKPRKPAGVSKTEWEMSDAVIDYEVRLQNYYRYNKITPPKKK